MNAKTLEAAVYQARRFIERAEALKKAAKDHSMSADFGFYAHPKESGAVRRASLDLTRALAEMRKPG